MLKAHLANIRSTSVVYRGWIHLVLGTSFRDETRVLGTSCSVLLGSLALLPQHPMFSTCSSSAQTACSLYASSNNK